MSTPVTIYMHAKWVRRLVVEIYWWVIVPRGWDTKIVGRRFLYWFRILVTNVLESVYSKIIPSEQRIDTYLVMSPNSVSSVAFRFRKCSPSRPCHFILLCLLFCVLFLLGWIFILPVFTYFTCWPSVHRNIMIAIRTLRDRQTPHSSTIIFVFALFVSSWFGPLEVGLGECSSASCVKKVLVEMLYPHFSQASLSKSE